MDCQKLITYGLIVIIGLYLLKNVCGVNIPFMEAFTNSEDTETGGANPPVRQGAGTGAGVGGNRPVRRANGVNGANGAMGSLVVSSVELN